MVDSGRILEDSLDYAKEGLAGRWDRWILLIFSCIVFPLFLGYAARVYRGASPSPEPENWGGMFIDGIKLMIVGLVYALPVLILEGILFASPGMVKTSSTNPDSITGLLLAVLLSSIVLVIAATLILLIITIAGVRFARTDNFSEAFNFREILARIGKIGWMDYIVSLLMMFIVIGITAIICLVLPFIGPVLLLILLPALGLFSARYITLLYESGGPE